MSFYLTKKLLVIGAIYFSAIGIAQAQQGMEISLKPQASSLMCSDKAKDVARKAFGNCLADQKAQEIIELRKQYVKDLEEMRSRHQKEVAELRQERLQLRKGIINTSKMTPSQTVTDTKADVVPILNPIESTIAQKQPTETPTVELKKIETLKESVTDSAIEVVETKESFE